MNYWLLKSEPSVFGIEHLEKSPRRTAAWDGVRNYQARNMLRDEMKPGDRAFFYHSSADPTGIAGIIKIASAGYVDATALDRKHAYYDAESDPSNPRWYCVDVTLERRFDRIITLDELKSQKQATLRDFALLRRGNRLSVMPVKKQEWDFILSLE